MARPAKSAEKLQPYSFRTSDALRREMRHAGGKMDMEDAEALRLAAAIGFKFLRMIDYDVPGAVIEQAIRNEIKRRMKKGEQP